MPGRASLTAYLAFLFGSLSTIVNGMNSSGCGKALASGINVGGTGQSNNLTISSSGVQRTYLLHVPTAYIPSKSHGLIFSFHGRDQTASDQEELSQFSNSFFNPHMLAVYPQGLNNEWQGDPDASTNDVSFTLDMITAITAEYCVDENMVYVAGKSNGGGFAANILACDPNASKKIAAFAAASGAFYQGTAGAACDAETVAFDCHPGRQVIPIIETHGTADPIIPYSGGSRRDKCLPQIPHFMTSWSNRNGFGAGNESTSMNDGKVTKYQFDSETSDHSGIITHYKIDGLGHAWPSTVANVDGGPTFFNATELFMDFFNKWPLNATVNLTGG
ncbi:putative feruloyl esterase C [Acrodontium crateriforme]|uniref:feruloyl esterase n=1 Tax=Acrodontium crateriforme TaxID=150365 RepID=A0AAQ3M084_9PEZI|nr:putative feruloyl esterase C [Acrodontium crateriforme]